MDVSMSTGEPLKPSRLRPRPPPPLRLCLGPLFPLITPAGLMVSRTTCSSWAFPPSSACGDTGADDQPIFAPWFLLRVSATTRLWFSSFRHLLQTQDQPLIAVKTMPFPPGVPNASFLFLLPATPFLARSFRESISV